MYWSWRARPADTPNVESNRLIISFLRQKSILMGLFSLENQIMFSGWETPFGVVGRHTGLYQRSRRDSREVKHVPLIELESCSVEPIAYHDPDPHASGLTKRGTIPKSGNLSPTLSTAGCFLEQCKHSVASVLLCPTFAKSATVDWIMATKDIMPYTLEAKK